jgi:thioredoxin reductase
MGGLDVFVVGAGNSAGQAAAHLAGARARVTVLVRGGSLTASVTGRDLGDQQPGSWPLNRAPAWLETGMPGVFAAGDIRRGSVKPVAAAVGEGSTAAMPVPDQLTEAR